MKSKRYEAVPALLDIIALLVLAGAGVVHAADASTPVSANVRDFGATGDGATLDTGAITKAIDFCFQKGGGTVRFPAGRYLTGTIILKDNVTLHLEAQATILGSLDIANYSTIDPFVDAVGVGRGKCLIGADGAKNIGIEGDGVIDGQGKQLVSRIDPKDKADTRPFLMRWVRCQGLSLQGVHLEDSAAWTVHIYQCERVSVSAVTIYSVTEPNNDGIDIDSSNHVTVQNCTIETEDDSICLKATNRLPCSEITVTGCTLTSGCGTIKLGTESLGDFHSIQIHDCHVIHAGKGAIKLLSEDGALMQSVNISNITVDQADTPIFLRLGSRLKTFRPSDQARPIGSLKDITIQNVIVHNGGTSMLSGIPGHPIENVILKNIEVHGPGFACKWKDLSPIPEKETAYPETAMFGRPPASGFYARHVQGLTLQNIQLETNPADRRPLIVCDDAQDLIFSDWTVLSPIPAASVMLLQSTQRASLHNINLTSPVHTLLAVNGANSSDIRLDQSDASRFTSLFVLGTEAKPGIVTTTP